MFGQPVDKPAGISQAFAAGNASKVLEVFGNGKIVDLLVTDAGLPGMNCRELAADARKLKPDLPISFATCYADVAMNRCDLVGWRMDMVGRPYDVNDLPKKIGVLFAMPNWN